MRPGTTVISPSNVLEAITCEVKPGNAFEGGVTGSALILQPGLAALTDGLDAIVAALWPEPTPSS
jgi:hypothetical protein